MQPDEHLVYLGLGANIGDRLANLRTALLHLGAQIRVQTVSSLYETEPVGVTDQPRFLNAVCFGRTLLDPVELLAFVKQVERNLGRRPGPVWGPRPLDVDILLFDGIVFESDQLQIPHPRLIERAFVLVPLAELSPHVLIPNVQQSAAQLRDGVDASGVRRLAGPEWASENPKGGESGGNSTT